MQPQDHSYLTCSEAWGGKFATFSQGEHTQPLPLSIQTFLFTPFESGAIGINPATLAYLKKSATSSALFLVWQQSLELRGKNKCDLQGALGTIVRLESLSTQTSGGILLGKVTGRQRGRILGLAARHGNVFTATVEVIDPPPGEACLHDTLPATFRRGMTYLPPALLNSLDARALCSKLRALWELRVGAPLDLPLDTPPAVLAWSCLRSLPMPSLTRSFLYGSVCTVSLLHGLLHAIKKEVAGYSLCCCHCSQPLIAGKVEDFRNPFLTPGDGGLGEATAKGGLKTMASHVFVNPSGISFRVFTARREEEGGGDGGGGGGGGESGLEISPGAPIKQHSWFPGYAWRNMGCKGCGEGCGWVFTATEEGTQPSTFFAFTEESVAVEALL